MKVDGEEAMLGLAAKCRELGITWSIVRDAGRTQVRDAGRTQVRDAGKTQVRDAGRTQVRPPFYIRRQFFQRIF